MFRFRRQVYLDNHATTSVARNVRKKMDAVLADCFGNPSSPYRLARNAAAVLEDARQVVARAVGALPEEIIFTGSASEANNQVLKSFLSGGGERRKKIVSTPIEHSSVMAALAHVQREKLDVVFCPVAGDGRLDFQALGKIPVDVQALGVDYATFSAHKIHGPKGVGALYAKRGSLLHPLIHGGHQENGLRAGTEGLHNIAGFAEACRNIPAMLARAEMVAQLRDRFVRETIALHPGICSHSIATDCLPNTASLTFPGFDNAELLAYLDYHGIGASAGSACNTEDNAPSHVLTAIGLTAEQARQTLRFSLSTQTRPGEIRYTVAVLSDYLQRRKLPVTLVSPAQLDENMLFSDSLFVIDIRNEYDRKFLKGLPNSRETSKKALKGALHAIPRNKNVLIVCQAGMDAPMMAYFLRSKGIRNVGFLMGGMLAWKLFQPALYKKFGDMNITPLEQNSATP